MPTDEKLRDSDTIVAPVTGSGSAVAIVRISGPSVKTILEHLCQDAQLVLSQPRTLVAQALFDITKQGPGRTDTAKQILDRALVVYFPRPRSFTGEDVAEFHVHGSQFVVERLIACCLSEKARLAGPGEFSKRAFLNGKLDLSQAEAVADLIAAETESQARVATEQLDGKLSRAVSDLGEPLRDLLAEIEAYIDFPEEGIEPKNRAAWLSSIENTEHLLGKMTDSFQTGKLYREGARVVIVGLPNAGKSSLLNRLVGERRAIVTPHAGTTRDSIEERINIDGLLVRLWDTAGLACGPSYCPDEIEALGIERSWEHLRSADLAVYVTDVTADFAEEIPLFHQVRQAARKVFVAGNKGDLLSDEERSVASLRLHQESNCPTLIVSALMESRISELKTSIAALLLGMGSVSGVGSHVGSGAVLICNQRHVTALTASGEALIRTRQAISEMLPPEIISIDLRSALLALNEIIGLTHTEDILGRIFSKFCIGK